MARDGVHGCSIGRHSTPARRTRRSLLLFLDNTGARVQEAADLRREHLAFVIHRRVSASTAKAISWRTCSSWDETAQAFANSCATARRRSASARIRLGTGRAPDPVRDL